MFVIVATFDNCDPATFGPFQTEAEATAAVAKVRAKLDPDGDDDSITDIIVRPTRSI